MNNTIWKQDKGTAGKLSKVSTTSLVAKKGFAATTAAKFLDTSKYTYYISMESTDAAKGGSAYYNVEIDNKSVFFDSADTGLNNVLYDKKAKAFKSDVLGSNDANILCLTDDANGDGIFVDDEFTELPEGITEQQSRIARINEIRAGAGDDIVDMTSRRFEYIGDGLTICGGDGDDTIWANKGGNRLFGDAGNDCIVGASGHDVIAGGSGNDRMHGGGGNDIFTFCDNWGADTVEQLETGSVTLWFASGSIENWDKNTLTYTEGNNSVKVTGVTSVELKFGDDDSEQYATLAQAGAFLDFTSERIFEESGKGVLASL